MAKRLAGDLGRTAGLLPGAARGLWHTTEDVAHAAYLGQALNPAVQLGPAGDLFRQQLADDAVAVGLPLAAAIKHPKAALEDAALGLSNWRKTIDPRLTPQAETPKDEFLRQFSIGLNQGELGFDVLSTFVAPELRPARLARIARVSAAGRAGRGALRANKLGPWSPTVAYYKARGVPDGMAEYFATPYKGDGHHYWGRKRELPRWLGGGYLPPVILESRFNVLKPRGLTTGEMHELHANVDGHFRGGKIPAEFGGGGWSVKKLGWERYGRLGRVWYGAPSPLKAAVGGPLALGTGAAVDYLDSEEDVR